MLRGYLSGRQVAVKKMVKEFHPLAEKEVRLALIGRLLFRFNVGNARQIALLIRSDGHPNVVRYFDKEESDEFVYLALELCTQSLAAALHKLKSTAAQETIGVPTESTRRFLRGIVQGVNHLHKLRIAHRDIKPGNILLTEVPRDATAQKTVSSRVRVMLLVLHRRVAS